MNRIYKGSALSGILAKMAPPQANETSPPPQAKINFLLPSVGLGGSIQFIVYQVMTWANHRLDLTPSILMYSKLGRPSLTCNQ